MKDKHLISEPELKENDENDLERDEFATDERDTMYDVLERALTGNLPDDEAITDLNERKIFLFDEDPWFWKYRTYDASHTGCNIDNPFLIKDTEDYVQKEYDKLNWIALARGAEYDLIQQSLLVKGDRHIDEIIIETTFTDPTDFLDERLVTAIEKYYFDITDGYNALSKYISEHLGTD